MMDRAEYNAHMRLFLSRQKEAFERLIGFEVVEWRGREMALDESPSGPIWRIPGIEMRQFDRMQLVGATKSVSIGTAQNDDRFGLWLPDDDITTLPGGDFGWVVPVENSPFAAKPESIFRDIRIPELPLGPIGRVSVAFSAEGTEVETVNLTVGEHVVSLAAGEVYCGTDGSVTVCPLDESILVQVDGRHPDQDRTSTIHV